MSRIFFLVLILGIACLRVAQVFTIQPTGTSIRTIAVSQVPQENNAIQYIDIDHRRVALPHTDTVSLGDTLVLQTKETKNSITVTSMKVKHNTNVLYRFRKDFISYVYRNTPSPLGEVLVGIVIGARDILSTSSAFSIKQSGITHLLIASGTNVSFIVLCVFFLTQRSLGRIRATPFVFIGVWLYVLLVGFEPAIVRAAFTFSFVSLLTVLGLYIPTFAILLWVFLFFVIVTPTILADVGFYLSFSSVAGILLLDTYFYRLLRFVPVMFVRKSFSTSLAASVSVAPISLLIFKSFPLITIISTLLVSWVTIPILALTPIAFIISIFSPSLSYLILSLTFPLADYFLLIANLCSFL